MAADRPPDAPRMLRALAELGLDAGPRLLVRGRQRHRRGHRPAGGDDGGLLQRRGLGPGPAGPDLPRHRAPSAPAARGGGQPARVAAPGAAAGLRDGGAGGQAPPAGGFRGRRHACRAALDGPGASVPGPARPRPRALTAGRRTNWKNRAVGNSSRTDRALRANPVRRPPTQSCRRVARCCSSAAAG